MERYPYGIGKKFAFALEVHFCIISRTAHFSCLTHPTTFLTRMRDCRAPGLIRLKLGTTCDVTGGAVVVTTANGG